MKSLQVYSSSGSKSGTANLPKEFDVKPNMNLLSQALYVYQDRSHKGTSKVKTRSEVSRTGAKVYRQKGTGGARHGDKKAPIFVGGGKAHGPKGVKRTLVLPKKLKSIALRMTLKAKLDNGNAVFADKLSSIKNTKEANNFLNKVFTDLKLDEKSTVLLVLSQKNNGVIRPFRNIQKVKTIYWRVLNALSVSSARLIIIDKDAMGEEVKTEKAGKEKSVKPAVKKESKSKKSSKEKPVKVKAKSETKTKKAKTKTKKS